MAGNLKIPAGRGWIALAVVLAAAAALRLGGIGWGLPTTAHPEYSYHADEMVTMMWARMLAFGMLDAHQLQYGGSLYFSLLNAEFHLGQALRPWLQQINPWADAILIGRLCGVACSVGSVALVYGIGRHLFDAPTALLAALLMALVPGEVILAPTTRPDSAGVLFVGLLLYCGARVLQGAPAQDRRWALYAGIATGACIAFRFPPAAFAVAPVLALFLRERPQSLAAAARIVWHPRTATYVVAVLAAYVVTSPYSFMHPDTLRAGLRLTWAYGSGRFLDALERGPSIFQYGGWVLRETLGWPLYGLAVAATLATLLRPSRSGLLLVGAALPYVALLALNTWTVVRYALPLTPVLCLLAAAALVDLPRRLPRVRTAVVAAACAVIVWTGLLDVAFVRVMAGRNIRDQMSDWIAAEVPRGASIVSVLQYADPTVSRVYDDVYYNPVIPPGYARYEFVLQRGAALAELGRGPHDYLVLNEVVFKNMERLGARHPLPAIVDFGEMLKASPYRLTREFAQPVAFAGLDFSGQFTALDYVIVNPRIRIYRRAGDA